MGEHLDFDDDRIHQVDTEVDKATAPLLVNCSEPDLKAVQTTDGSSKSFSIPCRYVLVTLCSLGCVVVYCTRVCMSFSLVCMVNHTAIAERSRQRNGDPWHTSDNHNGSIPIVNCDTRRTYNSSQIGKTEDGPFVWEEEMQGVILSSFFWGYIFTQIPAGILADKIGGKWILGSCLVASSLFTMAIPYSASISVYLVIALRVLTGLSQGAVFPTITSIVAAWAPRQERSILNNLSILGCSIGNILAFPLSASLCESKDGWKLIFYVFGGMGLLWFCLLWLPCMSNKPAEHPWISNEEMIHIEANSDCSRHRHRIPIPWRSVLTSPAFLSFCIICFTSGFKYFMLLTQLPTYVKVVLNFDLEENGLINLMPYLISFPTSIFGSFMADFIKNTGRFQVTTVRKTFTFVGSTVGAIALIFVPYAGCNYHLVLGLLWLSMASEALNAGGAEVNPVELAPNMAGTIHGIANSFTAAGGIVAPYIVGILTQNDNTKRGWDKAFYLSSFISLSGLVIFIIFGSSETQSWNNLQQVKATDGDDDKLLENASQTT